MKIKQSILPLVALLSFLNCHFINAEETPPLKIEILEFQKKIEIPKKYFARFKFFFASPKNNGTIQLEKKSLFWEFKIKF